MKGFYLYFLLSMLTRNPIVAFVIVVLIYLFADKFYFGFLPDFSKMFRTSQQLRNNLKELQLNPQNARAALSAGILYFEKKRYKEALKYLEHPKLKNDDSANYYNYFGMTLMELKRADEGKEYIIKAIELDPRSGYGLPYIYLIENELNGKSPDRSTINDLEQKIEKFSNTEILYKLGMVYKNIGNREKAKEFFSKALVEYSYCPRGIRRLHRKWAILSKIRKLLI